MDSGADGLNLVRTFAEQGNFPSVLAHRNGEDSEEQKLLPLLMTPRRPKGMKQEDGGRPRGQLNEPCVKSWRLKQISLASPNSINLS
jgi:hypothetical protein